MSKDPVEYLRGCDGLHNLLNVDGHTMIDIAKSAFLDTSKVHEDLYKRSHPTTRHATQDYTLRCKRGTVA